MNTTKLYVDYKNHKAVVEVSIICPYCGKIVEPGLVHVRHIPYNANGDIIFLTLRVSCCQKLFLSVHETTEAQTRADMNTKHICTYPETVPEYLHPEVRKLSPRFSTLYNQASFAEQKGFFELAGCGYRNAIEVLVKDFAVQILKRDESEVASKSFSQAIGAYLRQYEQAVTADVVRKIENGYTHYINNHSEIEFPVYKEYVRLCIETVTTQIRFVRPPVPVPDRGLLPD